MTMRIVLATKPEVDEPWVADAAARLAKQTGASVSVVSADNVELERLEAAPRSVALEHAERTATAAVERLRAAGVDASKHVLSGRALDRILEFADEQNADLIMVGSSNRPAVAERLLGSVPLALVQKSSRPVVVVTNPSHAS
jgi:nucleotide-binding universal stress UspA family protein